MDNASDGYTYLNREISWLQFSHRVLQEAADPSVPLLERVFFCGIFSSNLDEYFRVRVASLRSLLRLDELDPDKLGFDPDRLLHDIHRVVLEQQETYGGIIDGIFDALAAEGIRRVDESSVPESQAGFLRSYFERDVVPHLDPIFMALEGEMATEGDVPFLHNHAVYLVVEIWRADEARQPGAPCSVLVEVPASLPRFVTLPCGTGDEHLVMFLDDVIRFNLDRMFPEYEIGRSYAVKLTRDADLQIDDEFDGALVDAIRTSLKNRETGLPSRFLYDMRAPYSLIHLLQHRLGLSNTDMVLGARYHNLNDYMGFPRCGRDDLSYEAWPEIPHAILDGPTSVFAAIHERDQVLHTPYQSFGHVVRFLQEAAGDPDVEEVWLTVYRVASDSSVLKALIEAAEAGKRVTVFMEVQARFDEESNLEWAERLEAAGVRTLYSMKGLKVHAKLAMVARREAGERRLYVYAGTGNFSEKTARIYADHGIFTCDERITRDVEQVFLFLTGEVEEPRTEHLLVAPFTMRTGFNDLIGHEAKRAAASEPSGMTLKMNSLQDPKIIRRLYDAAVAGVPIEVIVRGICCLIPGVTGQSESIHVRSILDRLLEHARIYIFHHDGEERMYLASADWMKRNLSRRIEVAIPVYDPEARRQLRALVDFQLADNLKARVIEADGTNAYVVACAGEPEVRSQDAFRNFVAELAARG
jgi:polyphosphate kinase